MPTDRPDIAAIRERHRFVAPHIKQRQTWKDIEYLLARIAELERENAELTESLAIAREARDTAGTRTLKSSATS